MKKILSYIAVVIAIAAAAFVAFHFNPDSLLRGKQEEMGMGDIKAGKKVTGHPAGKDIPHISSVKEFDKLYTGTDHVTLQPVSIVPTGVWHLKSWVKPYSQRRYKGRATGAPRKKPEVIVSKLDIHMDYNPYYLLELQDGNYIIAEIPEPDADAVRKGKKVTLPIGEKRTFGMTESLRKICEEYHADTSGVFFAFDEEWYQSIDLFMVLSRIGVGVVVFFGVGVCLLLLIDKVIGRKPMEDGGDRKKID